MSLTRRLFARALPAIPLAMKAAASAGISGGVGGMGVPGAVTASGLNAVPSSPGESYADHLKKCLLDLVANRGTARAEAMRYVSRLDADLASYRSLSLSTRIRLQAERDEERDFRRRSDNLKREIAEHARQAFL